MIPRSSFKSLAALASGLLCASLAQGAIVWSGMVDEDIPTSFNGVYLNIGSGTPTAPPDDPDGVLTDSYTIGYTEPADWDINIFFGGVGIAYSDTFSPFVDDPLAAGSQILNVAIGTDIQAVAASRAMPTATFGGSGRPEGGTGESHFDTPALDGATYSAFTPGDQGYIAFVVDIGGSDQYGWMRVTLNDDDNTGTIHEWAYSDEVGFEVGQIPEPSAILLGGIASLLLLRRRR